MKCVLCILATLAFAGFSVRAADNPEDRFVSSTWANGNGPNTQIWVLHVVGNTFTGAVCGPCDDPQSLAPIVDGRVIDAHHITLFTNHNLRGPDFAEYGPYRNECNVAFSGENGEGFCHAAGQPWTAHPLHMIWRLVAKEPPAGRK